MLPDHLNVAPAVPPGIALALLVAACGGTDSRIASTVDVHGRSATYEGMVTVTEGAPVREGETCRVRIERTNSDVWSCRVRVLCGHEMLYGLADAGYNRCDAKSGEFIAAEDRHGTRRDGDPRMRFDLERGRIVVSDDDPDIEVVIALMRDRQPREEAPHNDEPPNAPPNSTLPGADEPDAPPSPTPPEADAPPTLPGAESAEPAEP